MLETAIEYLSSVPWYWVLTFAFFITLIENIFPPSPSDTILVFTGTMVSIGDVGFWPLLIAATLGSTAGFIIMYYVGFKFEKAIIESGKLSFINAKTLEKPERWFRKYGYSLIVANRFLSGTRAVISFFAGISQLSITKTALLSAVSALAWNAILIYLGVITGNNWEIVVEYMGLYAKIIMPTVAIVAAIGVLFWWLKRRKNGKAKG